RDFHVTGVQTCALPILDGQLEHIYVDEGAYVQQGQPLFRINARMYTEQLNNAKAALAAAEANLANARLDVGKLTPLVKNQVVSRSEERRVGKEGGGRWW